MQKGGSWIDHVDLAVYSYNCSFHCSTGHTPFYLKEGRHPPAFMQSGSSTAEVRVSKIKGFFFLLAKFEKHIITFNPNSVEIYKQDCLM